jgi:hypothetical protein
LKVAERSWGCFHVVIKGLKLKVAERRRGNFFGEGGMLCYFRALEEGGGLLNFKFIGM